VVIAALERMRRGLAGTMLGLFLFGSNYCVLGALAFADTVPPCHAATTAQKPDNGGCCHPGRSDSESSSTTAPSSGSPCCMRATATGAPSIDKPITNDDAAFAIAPAAPLTIAVPPISAHEAWTHPPRLRARLLGSPDGTRAPPTPRA